MSEVYTTGTWTPRTGAEEGFAVQAWNAHAEFTDRMSGVRQHVAGFEPAELRVVAAIREGAAA